VGDNGEFEVEGIVGAAACLLLPIGVPLKQSY
jgi:hypothetical protein